MLVNWDGMELVFPLERWAGRTWYGGHFGSGRERSSVVYDPRRNKRMHAGYDFGCPLNEPILAVADGVVTDVGYNGGAGNYVTVRHRRPEGLYFWFRGLHINWGGTLVEPGQQVSAGQPLAKAGTTGASAGVHLHGELTVARPYVHFTEDKHIDIEYALLGTPGRHGTGGVRMPTSVQEDMKAAGYYTGVIDGIWGPKSAAAWEAMMADMRSGTGSNHQHTLPTLTGGVAA